jgi:hypothetical protein
LGTEDVWKAPASLEMLATWVTWETSATTSLRFLHAEKEDSRVHTCASVSEFPENSTGTMLAILIDASASVANGVALRAEPYETA